MAALLSSKELVDKKVYEVVEKKSKEGSELKRRRLGKVRACVFHPRVNVCVGIMVHRPDVAMMFHRPDMFVSLDNIDYIDGEVVLRRIAGGVDKAAEKRLGINLDECVIWNGLCVVTSKKEQLGVVQLAHFDSETGAVTDIVVEDGVTKGALLGKRVIPTEQIKGFAWGVGSAISLGKGEEEEDAPCGALVVDNAAKNAGTQGGVAEAAGKATAVATVRVKAAATSVKKTVKPTVDAGMKKAGAAANKGLYVTGRQLSRTKRMFSDFKEEYKKGLEED